MTMQENGTDISGTVRDANGEPIAGATVKVVGNNGGVATDIDGHFTVKAVRGAKLQISYIGFITQTVTVTDRPLNIILKEDNKSLNEVVVIGYGSQRKQDLSTAVSSVNLDQSMKSRPSTLSAMMQGSMPGVMVQNNGGDRLET